MIQYAIIFTLLFHQISLYSTRKVCNHDIWIPKDIDEAKKKFQSCEVLNGSLFVSHLSMSDCQDLSFPALVEIKHFLTIFGIDCPKMAMKLFPNLMIIRGEKLADGNALVVVSTSWKSLILPRLRVVLNGRISVLLNPYLCHMDTIDWLYVKDNFYENSKMRQSFDDHNFGVNRNICPTSCGVECNGRCWSHGVCQSKCNRKCTSIGLYCTIDDGDQCCHPQCLGGCHREQSARHCVSCRHVESANGICQSRCDPGFLMIDGQMCISTHKCSERGMFIQNNLGICLHSCPEEMRRDSDSLKYCQYNSSADMTRECLDIVIITSKDISRVNNCRTARSIIIRLQNDGTTDYLPTFKKAFSKLKVLRNFLHISTASGLYSLDFLKSLERIEGETLISNDKLSLEITDNKNLRRLWKQRSSFRIVRGKVRILANPFLCLKDIYSFISQAKLDAEMIQPSIINSTNGFLGICNVLSTGLRLGRVWSRSATVLLQVRATTIQYRVLNALIYYRLVYDNEEHTLNKWSDTDLVCDAANASASDTVTLKPFSDWPMQDSKQDEPFTVQCLLGDLKPASHYRCYVEIRFTQLNTAVVTEEIDIKTLLQRPSSPRNLTVEPQTPYTVRLDWLGPLHDNGPIANYVVRYRALSGACDSEQQQQQSDGTGDCSHPTAVKQVIQSSTKVFSDSSVRYSQQIPRIETECNSCAVCRRFCEPDRYQGHSEVSKDQWIYSQLDSRISFSTNVEVSNITTKLLNQPSLTRDIFDCVEEWKTTVVNVTEEDPNVQKLPSKKNHKFSVLLKNLHYFSEYLIRIFACQHHGSGVETNILNSNKCSAPASIAALTQPSPRADELVVDPSTGLVVNLNVSAILANAVHLSWLAPPRPNGRIRYYNLRYRALASADEKGWSYLCVPATLGRLQMQETVSVTLSSESLSTLQHREVYMVPVYHSGRYRFQLMAVSLARNGSWSQPQDYDILLPRVSNDKTMKITLSTLLPLLILLMIALTLTVYFLRRRQMTARRDVVCLFGHSDEWNVDWEDIQLLDPIGRGGFGIVYEGQLARILTPYRRIMEHGVAPGAVSGSLPLKVAVKTLSKPASTDDVAELLAEAQVMKQLLGHHLVRLVGLHHDSGRKSSQAHQTHNSDPQGHKVEPSPSLPLLLLEFMEFGDLSSYLHRQHNDVGATESTIAPGRSLAWAVQLADGMAYLASRRIVHCDLAARNCLLAADCSIKVADFGLARGTNDHYYYRKKGQARMPVRWMAPESLKSAYFTSHTDVWSYGVVLYEIATLASLPYCGMDHEQVIHFVVEGGRLETEDLKFPSCLLDIMEWCWSQDDSNRPSFMQMLEFLIPHFDSRATAASGNDQQAMDTFRRLSFYHNGYHSYDRPPSYFDEARLTGMTSASGCASTDFHDNCEPLIPSNGGHGTSAVVKGLELQQLAVGDQHGISEFVVSASSQGSGSNPTSTDKRIFTLSVDDILNWQTTNHHM